MFDEGKRTDPGVFATGGPGEIAQGLQPFTALDGVDPVTHLQPTHQRQNFVRGQIEGMERQAELWVQHQRKEPIGTIADPLQQDGLAASDDFCFDEREPFADNAHQEAVSFERSSVALPARVESTIRVDVARDPRGRQKLVQR